MAQTKLPENLHSHSIYLSLSPSLSPLSLYLSLSLIQELCSLMFSLEWVRVKAEIMGPAHLINDYGGVRPRSG